MHKTVTVFIGVYAVFRYNCCSCSMLTSGDKDTLLCQTIFQFRGERDAFKVLTLSSITVSLKQVVGLLRGNKHRKFGL